MGKLLVDWVSKIQLFPEDADRDSLSLKGLHYLLYNTYDTKKPFATYEISLLEYTLVKAKQIILEGKVKSIMDPYYMNNDPNIIEQIKDHLEPLLPHIDLRIIGSDDLVQKIEPLKIFSPETITKAYRYKVEVGNSPIQPMRGYLIFNGRILTTNLGKLKTKYI